LAFINQLGDGPLRFLDRISVGRWLLLRVTHDSHDEAHRALSPTLFHQACARTHGEEIMRATIMRRQLCFIRWRL
jgi:hypothetical protein